MTPSPVPSASRPAEAVGSPTEPVADAAVPRRGRRLLSSLLVKFALIGVLGNLPILYFGYKFVSLNLEEVAFAEKEQVGIAYLPYAWPIYAASIAGERAPVAAFAELAAAGALYDATLGTAFYRERFIEASLTGGDGAIAAGRSFITRIADNSNLSVDPDLNTLRAVAIVATNLPDVAESALTLFNDIRNVGDENERSTALDRFGRANALLNESLAATDALNFNTELTTRLGATQAALSRATRNFMNAAATTPIGADGVSDPAFAVAHADFQASLGAFWLSAAEALNVLLANRVAYLEGQLRSEIEIAGGLYLAVLLLIWFSARSLAGRARSLMRVVNRMRQGELDDPVPHTRNRDEIGDIARAVDVFRHGLLDKRAADEALQRQNVALVENRAELERQNVRFDAALNNMRHGLAMFDKDDQLVVWNRRFAEIYRLSDASLRIGAGYTEVAAITAGRGRLAEGGASAADNAERLRDGEFIFEFDDGRVLFVSNARMPDGGFVTTHEDITERRRAEAQITYMEFHDVLTMLPNRVLFKDRLEETLSQLEPGQNAALIHVDLDNFKSVNDTLGHQMGDALLKLVSERLLAAVDAGAFVARLAGDEFAVVMTKAARPQMAARLAEKIVDRLSKPYAIDSNQIAVGASVGIAVAPEHGTNAETLLKNADMALYRAKTDGRGGHRFFNPGMDAELQTKRVLEMDLRQALAHEELELYYQPLVDLGTDTIAGFEALLRWHHPSRGLVQPGDFIPLAEETGLIVPIGEWVLRRACAEAATWPDEIKVAVNLSSAQFRNRKLVSTVVSALSASQIRPARLELEITESLLLQDNEETLRTLHQLRSLGVRISMDDFGTGYSSLSYLRSFPFDKIKIDRSFVHDLTEKEESLAIIRAVVGLGRGLGIRTTAEGVETPHQLQILRDVGYSEVQGMLFSAPRPAAEVPRLLGRSRWSRAVA